jgi:DNA-binding NtrC family response regulator
MTEIRRKIEKLGRSSAPVLVLGETGTGKEVAARAIHMSGPHGPFVPVDCSVLGALLESELFGHTRGAFTGALNDKQGLLEAANGGTAFFDEIAEMPADLQAKLLRVLQEKEYRPVGSVARRKANFRVIAATNRDLKREVERGRFRQDLFYRLNVITLRLPPLRERKEDILPLTQHFLEKYGCERELSPSLKIALLGYDWPGNVRELENCVQRMCAMNSGPVLDMPDLPSSVAGWAEASDTPAIAGPAPVPVGIFNRPRIAPLEQIERQSIVEALAATGGDRVLTAGALGIGRTTLYRKMKRYGIRA